MNSLSPDQSAALNQRPPARSGPAYLRVTVETHDSRLEMDTRCGTVKYMEDRAVEAIRQGYAGLLITPGEKLSSTGSGKDVCSPNGAATGQCRTLLAVAHGSAVLCDMLGCHEHATGELLVGEELIPLCELHRRAEAERLMPKWRPLPSQSKPKTMSSSELSLSPSLGKPQTR